MTKTDIDTVPIAARTVSPITQDDGQLRWTAYSIELGEDGHHLEAIRYRTDSNGTGVWVWQPNGAAWVDDDGHYDPVYEWKQLVGYTQFSLNCSPGTRRERVLAYLGFGYDGLWEEHLTARERYARTARIPSDLIAGK